jgi:hypothetical protein
MKRREFIHTLSGAVGVTLGAGSLLGAERPVPDFPDPDEGIKRRGGWSLAVIPDTQNYAKYGKNQIHFEWMTDWIREHLDAWQIQAVLHEGDLVEQNDIDEGGGRGYGDQNATSQWTSAQHALAKLYGEVPTILATGNHDYGLRNAENRRTQFNNYFGLTDNKLVNDGRGGGIWRGGCANSFGAETLENAAYEIAAPDGRKLLLLSLEFGPRRESVAWAKTVLDDPAYRDHTGLLLTHVFLRDNGMRDGEKDGDRERGGNPHSYPLGQSHNTHDGEDLWNGLVKPSKQLQMVLNGHVMGRHAAYRHNAGVHGQEVHQMVFNAQFLGGGSKKEGNGGNGWIRLLTFEPDGRTVSARTFSPLLLKQGKPAWKTGPGWHFQFQLG